MSSQQSRDSRDKITTDIAELNRKVAIHDQLQLGKELVDRQDYPRIVQPIDLRKALPLEDQLELLWLVAEALGYNYDKATELRTKRDQHRQTQLAIERGERLRAEAEAAKQQLEQNQRDWIQPITEKLQLRDFIVIVPASNRKNFTIGREDGIVTGPACWCKDEKGRYEYKYNLVQNLHWLLNDSNHNWMWIRRRHTHLSYPGAPKAVSGFAIEEPYCIYLDLSALSRAKLGKPYTLMDSVLPQVSQDRPLI